MPNQTAYYRMWDDMTGMTDKKLREKQRIREQAKRDARLGEVKTKKYGTMPKIMVGKNK